MARVNEMTDLATVLEVLRPEGALKGKKVSITGHLGRPRKDVVAIIETAGGTFEETPRWGTDFLVTNNDWTAKTTQKGASRKLLAARQNRVRVISEQQLYDLIMANGETIASTMGEIDAAQALLGG